MAFHAFWDLFIGQQDFFFYWVPSISCIVDSLFFLFFVWFARIRTGCGRSSNGCVIVKKDGIFSFFSLHVSDVTSMKTLFRLGLQMQIISQFASVTFHVTSQYFFYKIFPSDNEPDQWNYEFVHNILQYSPFQGAISIFSSSFRASWSGTLFYFSTRVSPLNSSKQRTCAS